MFFVFSINLWQFALCTHPLFLFDKWLLTFSFVIIIIIIIIIIVIIIIALIVSLL
jgi:hypothetical protein